MIQVNGIVKQFGPQMLFEDVSFVLGERERVGLVGRNGSGKSTLFKMVLGEESYDEGVISIPKNYRIGSLKQHIEFSESSVLKECALSLIGDEAYDTYKAEKILFGLGFEKEDMERDPATFSGGYQIRINLAKVLLETPNLLLLDEPTNYLDIVSLRWLKSFLRSFQGEVIIITHDREFMNDVTTHTMGISRRQVKKIKGGTSKFYEQLELEDEIYEKTKANHDRKVKEMTDFVDRFRAKATKAVQAQSRLKQLEKMGSMGELEYEKGLGFHFNHVECPGKIIMNVENLSFSYDGVDELIHNLSFIVGRNDRIGIIGKNGKGKSTLLNLLARELTPVEGIVKNHPSLQKGHFGQTNISRLSENITVVDEITASNPDLSISRIRGICGTMLFEGEMAKKKIKVLSGGERSRVMLGKIIANKTNLLLLDEPTNHLDMESIETLSEEIGNYDGAVLVVTHSEMLLRKLVNKLIIFHKGKAEFFDGGYEEFLDKIGWEEELSGKEKITTPKLGRKELKAMRSEIINERSKILNPLKKRLEVVEHRITELEEIVEKSNAAMIIASENSDGPKIGKLSKIVSDSEEEIDILFLELEELTESVDLKTEEFEQRILKLEA